MKWLSIIIPLYNVEPYVEKCIRSLENQDIAISDYEIICVNDGSPDDSRKVVKRLQKEYSNILLIDQMNKGVSRARNKGIERACGKYLLFIDPDDFVDANRFGRILKNAEKRKAQVAFLGYTILTMNGTVRNHIFNKDNKDQVLSGLEAYRIARGDGRTDPDRMWAVLFESKFLKKNNLTFLPDVPYLEDGELIARILCLAKRCIFGGHSFYQRTRRPGSATNSELFHSEKATNGFLSAAVNLKKFQEQPGLDEKQREFLNQPICKFVLLALMSKIKKLTEFERTKNKLKSLHMDTCVLTGCNNYYKLEGTLYNVSPYLFLLHRKIGAPLLKIIKP